MLTVSLSDAPNLSGVPRPSKIARIHPASKWESLQRVDVRNHQLDLHRALYLAESEGTGVLPAEMRFIVAQCAWRLLGRLLRAIPRIE